MTAPTDYAPTDTAPAGIWRTEFADTVRLALPLALTQLGQIAMMTCDLLLIGRLGDQAVAAASLGHAALFSAFMLGLGLAAAVTPLAAQAFGARNPRMVRRALRVGMWAAVLAGIPITLGLLHTETVLLWFGQTPELSALAGRYLDGMAWCLTPSWLFIALRCFMSAVNRPQPVLWITLAAIPANAVLAYALIYGHFGLPALDLLGAGLATTIVNVGMFIASLWVCATQRPFRKFHILNRLWRPDAALLGKLVLLGLPISAAMVLEHGLFAAASLMMGWIGVSALAAHQIALQITAIVFMVPLGISFAATVRVGHAAGRRDADAARRAGIAAMVLGVGFQAAMAVCVVAVRDQLPFLFLGSAGSSATIAMASTLLLVGAAFFVVDGLQCIAAGSLRGFNDTFVPFLFAAFGFWAVGFVAAWLLAFNLGLGAAGIWIGLSIGLAVYASLLVWRFKVLTDRGHLPRDIIAGAAVTEQLEIAYLGHRGDGIVDAPDGPIYVPCTLPGERVDTEPWPSHPDRRHLLKIISASDERVTPPCPHFGTCGGCALQHWLPAPYRAWKRSLVTKALQQTNLECNVAELVDAHGAGRRRATFHARRSGRDILNVGFAAAQSHHIVPIDRCPILAPSLDGAITAAWAIAQLLDPARKPLDIQCTSTDIGIDMDVRGSGALSPKLSAKLAQAAGQQRLARLTRHGELVSQRSVPTIRVGRATVELPAGVFLQATVEGEETLARLVVSSLAGAKTAIDLFCGVGPFALRIAEFARVTAADNDEAAIAALTNAAPAPGLKPVTAQVRDLFRRPFLAPELKGDAVVFDPPRQGAEAQAREIAKSKVPIVVAVSCNPTTFARDAKILCDGGYRLTQVTPVDQFRYSAHTEVAAKFVR